MPSNPIKMPATPPSTRSTIFWRLSRNIVVPSAFNRCGERGQAGATARPGLPTKRVRDAVVASDSWTVDSDSGRGHSEPGTRHARTLDLLGLGVAGAAQDRAGVLGGVAQVAVVGIGGQAVAGRDLGKTEVGVRWIGEPGLQAAEADAQRELEGVREDFRAAMPALGPYDETKDHVLGQAARELSLLHQRAQQVRVAGTKGF